MERVGVNAGVDVARLGGGQAEEHRQGGEVAKLAQDEAHVPRAGPARPRHHPGQEAAVSGAVCEQQRAVVRDALPGAGQCGRSVACVVEIGREAAEMGVVAGPVPPQAARIHFGEEEAVGAGGERRGLRAEGEALGGHGGWEDRGVQLATLGQGRVGGGVDRELAAGELRGSEKGKRTRKGFLHLFERQAGHPRRETKWGRARR
jgi:hypothetical protein